MANFRVQQWGTFCRQWWVYDAKWQCPFRSAPILVRYLEGKWKPIFHPLSDIGDHVVVINTEKIALRNEEWRTRIYEHETKYPKSKMEIRAWKVHRGDPNRILWKECYETIRLHYLRRNTMARLHMYPDENIPPQVLANINGQIPQVMPVPRKLHEYSAEERKNFPRLFEWPEEHVRDPGLRDPEQLPPPEPYIEPGRRKGPEFTSVRFWTAKHRLANKGLPPDDSRDWRTFETFE